MKKSNEPDFTKIHQGNVDEIEITFDHIKLLRAAHVYWNYMEFGAPTIDPKYPYGDDMVLQSVAKVIGMKLPDFDNDEDFTSAQMEKLERLHAETGIALQIFLQTGKMEAGHYIKKDQYANIWVRR